MKRTFRLFTIYIFIFVLMTCITTPTFAGTVYTYGDYTFIDYNPIGYVPGTATITKYTGTEVNLDIPDNFSSGVTIDGKTFGHSTDVTEIGVGAFRNNDHIVHLTIPEGVYKIDQYAFEGCDNLETVDLPDSLMMIAIGAFKNCPNLRNIRVKRGVTLLEASAFEGCSSLANAQVECPINTLPNNVFKDCTNLTHVVLHDSIKKIGSAAFYNCGFLRHIELPDNLETIDMSAFSNCDGLVGIRIPEYVTQINNQAFWGCDRLSEVHFAGNAPNMGQKVFFSTPEDLEITYLSDTTGYGTPIWNIADNKSLSCHSRDVDFRDIGTGAEITKYTGSGGHVDIKDEYMNLQVRSIGEQAFESKPITSVRLPNNLTAIGASAFKYCDKLEKVTMPSTVSKIAYGAFAYCSNLEYVTFLGDAPFLNPYVFFRCDPDFIVYAPRTSTGFWEPTWVAESDEPETNTYPFAYNDYLFESNGTNVTITEYIGSGGFVLIPETIRGLPVTSIADNTFEGNTDLRSIQLANTIKTVGANAFKNCTGLTSLHCGTQLESIGDSAFENTTNLFSITFNDQLKDIGSDAFRNSSKITKIIFPQSIRTISDNAFRDCSNLLVAIFQSDAPALGTNVFTNCALKFCIYYPAGANGYDGSNWIYPTKITEYAYSIENSEVTIIAYMGPGGHVDVPNLIEGYPVKTLFNDAFSRRSDITSITLPEGLETIGTGVFNSCKGLTQITFPTTLKSIGGGAFNNCTSLDNVHIPDGTLELSTSIFSGCSSLKTITIPDALKEIPSGMFTSCISLEGISFPSNLETIGYFAFSSCTAIETMIIPDTVTKIDQWAFDNCRALKNLTLSSNLITISPYAFGYCDSLEEVRLPASVATVGTYSFARNNSLATFYFEGNAPVIEDDTFKESDVTLVYNETSTGFSSPTWHNYPCYLESGDFLYYESNDTITIGAYLGSKSSLRLPESIEGLPVVKIHENAFKDNSTLEVVYIPQSITTIDQYSFNNCINLKKAYVFADEPSIHDRAFWKCSPDFEIIYGSDDGIAPIIKILGDKSAQAEYMLPYKDAGAVASDNLEGIITDQIQTLNFVDTSILGPTRVTYHVEDLAGNYARVTRSVQVIDTLPPTLELLGENPITLEYKSKYIEPGIVAMDIGDGNLTDKVEIINLIDYEKLGPHSINYSVSDSSDNTTKASREVIIVDNTPPVLTLNGSNPTVVHYGGDYDELKATAIDNYDGDISNNVEITGSVNVKKIGIYILTYTVSDSSGITSTTTRTVKVVDEEPPALTLNGDNPSIVHYDGDYAELGATALDNYDGDISDKIQVTGSVNNDKLGIYSLTYTVSDTSGNTTTLIREVHILDVTPPVITLIGRNPEVVELNGSYKDASAFATDNYDGDITSALQVNNPVDTSILGTYNVTYNVSDSSNNKALEVSRTVNVVPYIDKILYEFDYEFDTGTLKSTRDVNDDLLDFRQLLYTSKVFIEEADSKFALLTLKEALSFIDGDGKPKGSISGTSADYVASLIGDYIEELEETNLADFMDKLSPILKDIQDKIPSKDSDDEEELIEESPVEENPVEDNTIDEPEDIFSEDPSPSGGLGHDVIEP